MERMIDIAKYVMNENSNFFPTTPGRLSHTTIKTLFAVDHFHLQSTNLNIFKCSDNIINVSLFVSQYD